MAKLKEVKYKFTRQEAKQLFDGLRAFYAVERHTVGCVRELIINEQSYKMTVTPTTIEIRIACDEQAREVNNGNSS